MADELARKPQALSLERAVVEEPATKLQAFPLGGKVMAEEPFINFLTFILRVIHIK
jgi:hypothetical protein